MKFSVKLFCIVSAFFSSSLLVAQETRLTAEPEHKKTIIHARQFIQKPHTTMAIFSPSGKYFAVAGYRRDLATLDVIDAADPEKRWSLPESFKSRVIRGLVWIDESHLFIHTGLAGRRNTTNYLVTFSADGGLSVEEAFFNGWIVDPMPTVENQALVYQWESNRGALPNVSLYSATTEQLVNDTANRAKPDKRSLKGYVTSYEDTQNGVEIAYIRDEKKSRRSVHRFIDGEWSALNVNLPSYQLTFGAGVLQNGDVALGIVSPHKGTSAFHSLDPSTGDIGNPFFSLGGRVLENAYLSKDRTHMGRAAYQRDGLRVWHHMEKIPLDDQPLLNSLFPNSDTFLVDAAANGKGLIVAVTNGKALEDIYFIDKTKKNAVWLGDKNGVVTPELLSSIEVVNANTRFLKGVERHRNNTLLITVSSQDYIDAFDKLVPITSQFLTGRGYDQLFVELPAYKDSEQLIRDNSRFITEQLEQFTAESDISYDNVCVIGSRINAYYAANAVATDAAKYDCFIGRFGFYDTDLRYTFDNIRSDIWAYEAKPGLGGVKAGNAEQHSPIYAYDKFDMPILFVGNNHKGIGAEAQKRFEMMLALNPEATVEKLQYRRGASEHNTMNGHRHELAYIDEFLRRHFNIPLIKGAEAVHNSEYQWISEGFGNRNLMEVDADRVEFYRRKSN